MTPLRKQLKPGERVLWHGQPQDRFDFREVPLIAVLMAALGGVLFGGIGVALLYVYFFKTAGRVELWAVVLLLFGIVFLLTGLYILLGPWLQRFVRQRTFYAITDERILIVNERPWHRVVALDLDRLVSERVLLETQDGSGDIELGFAWGAAAYPAFWLENDFEFIRNVREVEALLLLARSPAAPAFPDASASWPPGIFRQPAPKPLAWLNVLIFYFCIALYPILIWADMKELSRLRISAFDPPPPLWDNGMFSPASYFALAPFMMFFFYSRARKFQTETKVPRYFDVAVAVVLIAVGGLLWFWAGIMSDPGVRTGGFVVLSVFALLMARGTLPETE